MKHILRLTLLVSLLLCCSCGIKINGSLRGLYSYYNQTKAESPELLVRPGKSISICSLKPGTVSTVYIINADRLRECLKQHDKAVVYIWNINCGSEFCYPLNIMQQACDANGIELYVVARYYDSKPMKEFNATERPIFGIDTRYYSSNLTSKYMARFQYDLTASKDYLEHILYFENGKFVDAYKSIDSLEPAQMSSQAE